MPDIEILRHPERDKAVTTPKPLATIHGFELYNRPRPKIDYLIDRLVPAGAKFVLSGTRAAWKSWTMSSMAACVATVSPFIDRFAVCPHVSGQGSVLFVQLEESIDEAQRKYQWVLTGLGLAHDPQRIQDMLVEFIVGQPFTIEQEGRLDEIKRAIDDLKPDLVIWDSLRRMMRGDSNTDEFAQRLVHALDELREVHPSAHGIVAHWRKKAGEKDLNDPEERVRGTSAILDQVDVHLSIERNKIEDFATMRQTKNRMGKEIDPFNYRMSIADTEGMAAPVYIGSAAGTAEEGAQRAILDILAIDKNRIWKQSDLAREEGLRQYNADQIAYAIDTLARKSRIEVERKGRGFSPLVKFHEPMEATVGGRNQSESDRPTYATPYKDDT